jgi:protein XagA
VACRVRRVGRRVTAIALAVLVPAAAFGSAWTWPEGTGQAILSLTGGEGDFGGQTGLGAARETRLDSSLDVEFGLRDGLTGFVQSGLEDYAVAAPVADTYRGFDYSGAGLRQRLFSSQSLVWSVQGTALFPGARDALRPAQVGNTGFDSDWRTLVGASFAIGSWPSFLDASAGYLTRAGGPPGDWRADLTFGSHPRPDVTIMLQSFNSVSNGSRAPLFPSEQTMVVEPSLVYDFDKTWSVQVGAYTTLRAVNANRETGIVLALWRRF